MWAGNVERFSLRLKSKKCSLFRFTNVNLLFSGLPFRAATQKVPLVFGLSALDKLKTEEKKVLVSSLHQCLDSSRFYYNREGSIGLVSPSLQHTMQWFAVTLLNGRLPYLKPSDTPVLVETTEDDLLLTFAASDVTRLTNTTLERHKKVAVFGEVWDLVTVKYWALYMTLLSVLQCLEFLTSEY